jgi:uncharacterized phage protein gp47/JayE
MAVVMPSFDEFVALAVAEAQSIRASLAFLPSDYSTALVHGGAAMADKLVGLAAQLALETFIDGARGDALTALVDDHCNVQRHAATFARTTAHFQRTSGGASGTIPIGTKVGATATPDGKQAVFTTDAAISVGAANNGPFSVSVTAIEAGPESNVELADGISVILDPLFDSTFTVGQTGDAAGGNLAETDPELRKRARLHFLTLRRGTLLALEYAALLVPAVRVARAIEDPETFQVAVVVSDADGGSTQQMVADAAAEIEDWRCAGAPVVTFGGTKVLVDITVRLKVIVPGFDVETATTAIEDAITEKINSRSGGQTLYLGALEAAAISVAPDYIEDVDFPVITVGGVTWLTGDVVPAGQNYTLRAGTITVVGPEG